ncbi:MAG: ATPase [Bacteroidales bacterium]|nr:ATPase [Bacteroidales bacterium]
MILIADSGSTKTAWVCVEGDKSIRFNTIGMNPYFVTKENIIDELSSNLPKEVCKDSIKEIYFYGSGCGRVESQQIVKDALKSLFIKAKICVDSDLVGAAIACYGNSSGIVAILGTGMNIGYWNGEKLETPMPSLGYIFGDAGSGAVLGRKLIQAIFEKRVSQELIDLFQQKYNLTLAELLDRVYKQPRPNTFLASFVPFFSENISNKELNKIVGDAYKEFATVYAEPIAREYDTNTIAFVGSLAQVFSDTLSNNLNQVGLQVKKIVASPLLEMQHFFSQKCKNYT